MNFEQFTPTSILLTVDNPLDAAPSVRLVERLAAATRARVMLLHAVPVVTPGVAHNTASLTLASMQASVSRNEAESSLWNLTEQLRGHGLEAASHVEVGDPADVILGQAEKLKADLLVMGRPTPQPSERWLLGSVVERVVQHVQVPVLVVPPGAATWRASQPVGVLITLDGSPLAERALPVGAGLARLLEGDLHLLRVANQRHTATARAYVEDVAVALQRECIGKVHGAVRTGRSTADEIRRFAHAQSVGLIALASHGRGGLSRAVMGSVAIKVVTSAELAVVVIPPRVRTPASRRASVDNSGADAHAS